MDDDTASEEYTRQSCLDAAIQSCRAGTRTDHIISRATQFYKFVKGQDKPVPTLNVVKMADHKPEKK